MAQFPVVLQHGEATGVLDGTRVRASILGAAAAVAVARGANQVIVPAPSVEERQRISVGMASIPEERRSLVRIVDTSADTWMSVLEYVRPLAQQAKKWPETAFVSFAVDFLYQLALATKYRAGILDDAVETVRGFVPILDPTVFSREARFRLSEILWLICRYDPAAPEHFAFTDLAQGSAYPSIKEVLDSAEYRRVVAASGRIGLVKHPLTALRRLGGRLRDVLRKPSASALLRLGHAPAEVAGGKAAGTAIEFLRSVAEVSPDSSYWPPFLGLGSAELGIYRIALRECYPGANPPPGTIMVFERVRDGRTSRSWLNTGEESKLERDAVEALGSRREHTRQARQAAARYFQ